jgi:hypothetical protein
MAQRIHAIDDEIHKCMNQLQSIGSSHKSSAYQRPDSFLGTRAPEIQQVRNETKIKICGRTIEIECHPAFNVMKLNESVQLAQLTELEKKQAALQISDAKNQDLTEQIRIIRLSKQSSTSWTYQLFAVMLQTKAFKEWCHFFDPAFFECCDMKKIKIHSVDFFGPRIGFMKFETDIEYTPEMKNEYKKRAMIESNKKEIAKAAKERRSSILKTETDVKNPDIPAIVFMRGGAVAILVIILSDSGMRYSILVVQPRVTIGKFTMAELPAGMIDDDANFGGTAAKELEEETGIKINASDLEDLTEDMEYDRAYPSCGACDEFMKFYL